MRHGLALFLTIPTTWTSLTQTSAKGFGIFLSRSQHLILPAPLWCTIHLNCMLSCCCVFMTLELEHLNLHQSESAKPKSDFLFDLWIKKSDKPCKLPVVIFVPSHQFSANLDAVALPSPYCYQVPGFIMLC